jgi:hypothetical protein
MPGRPRTEEIEDMAVSAVSGERGRRSVRDAVTLEQANAVMPLLPPTGMSAEEKSEFFQLRAEMYRRVADKDPDHYYEALACAGLEQENADNYAGEAKRSKRSG